MFGDEKSNGCIPGSAGILPAVLTPKISAGWHSRGYLPHFDATGLIQSITFRLRDSLPVKILEQWKNELSALDTKDSRPHFQKFELRKRIEQYEDAGHGACFLRNPQISCIVQNALLHFDGERYRLLEWCIMPNHVHVLIETITGFALSAIIHSWKSFTATKANRLLGRTGEFWMHEHYDRFIRDEKHLGVIRNYIRNNPVKAGLVKTPQEWSAGSAGWMNTK